MPKLTLTHKGLLLVCIPLIFQFVFVFVLVSQVFKVQSQQIEESKIGELLSKIEFLSKDTMDCMYKIQMDVEIKQHGVVTQNTGQTEFRGLLKQFDDLVDSTNEPEIQKDLDRIKKELTAVSNSFSAWRIERSRETPDRVRLHDIAVDISQGLIKSLKMFQSIEERERKRMEDTPIRSEETKESIRSGFLLAVSISIVTTIGLAMFFINSIRKPLNRIAENTRRLAEEEPLLPPLRGSDELSVLDRLIQSVSTAVHDALERERELVANAADVICSINGDGIISSVNPYVEQLLGFPPTQVVGKSIIDFIHTDDVARADEIFGETSKSEVTTEFELRLRTADGGTAETSWSTSWSSVHQSLFCIVHDETERKKLERIKQDYIDMISHDLRSPLMAIHGSMTLIADGVRGPVSPEVLNGVKESASAIDSLTCLVNDLLDFQKLRAGKMQIVSDRFDLGDAIRESLDMVHYLAEKKDIAVSQPEGKWPVNADRNRLKQLIINLFSNAIKFSEPGESIRVEIVESADSIEVDVIDHGPGISEEFQEKIFEAFEQVPSSSKKKEGSGLGLAICKLIVEAHGGSIGVRSLQSVESDKTGSIFWFKIPRVDTNHRLTHA